MAVALAGCTGSARPTSGSAPATASIGTTSTTVDPDEVPDPSAASAKPPPLAADLGTSASSACRTGDPLANVYHPSRLTIVRPCATVIGVVAGVRAEPDGDVHVNLDLDPAFAGLVNDRNVSGEHGALVVEIVPADEPGCTPGQPPRPATGTYDYGRCTGADEPTPNVGDHISVTGPYVLDTAHGWMEIHPAWAIGGITATSSSTTTAGPTTTAARATSATGVTITSAPSSATPGQRVSLTAQTAPGAQCTLSVTLPSGRDSTASGLGPGTANASGAVTWTWTIGNTTNPGTATATVTCPGGSAMTHFQIT